ncbi:MAG: polysaccharide biosynthesis protein PslG [Solirubrobacteraceae bacterium]|nr:polysaccharide biosynthesis protein PslG [Solirubrobacteraceae bacterium]
MRRPALAGAVVAAILAAMLLVPTAAQSARPLQLGFLDYVYTSPDPAERAAWLSRSVDSAADILRIHIGWPVPDTPSRPASFDATNPADPTYDFSSADAAIRDATAHGLRVLISFFGAPRWAEGPNRAAGAPLGTWRPDPKALEDYGTALAKRYSGSFPDPLQPGASLPRVDAFQVWNEPNLNTYLTPQWLGGRTFAPAHYRRMLNAFYGGVKSVRRDALVVTAGTAPFGDPGPDADRIMPARFVRDMLCLRRTRGGLRGTACAAPARFDVLAHHPYSVGSPSRRALNADDVSIPDMGKLTSLLRRAEATGRALPRKRHRLWVTEVSYDSSPPDPDGVRAAVHARFVAETLYLLWRQGVDTITWFQIRDQAPLPSYAATNQSGIYYVDGREKPARRAFRFPFIAVRERRGVVRVWGRSPVAGKIVIERRTRSGWRALRTLNGAARGTFQALVRVAAAATLRARNSDDGETTISWRIARRDPL